MNNINLNKIITIMVAIIVFIAIILLLTSHSDNAKLELKGLSSLNVYQNDKFIDPGYEISNNDGYYVNVEGNVNTNKPGIYYLKYLLYNKSGSLISEKERRVVVLQDNISNITMNLIGEEEEYFFVNDYTDHGIEAYHKNDNVVNEVYIDSNVKESVPGIYEVKYQYTRGNIVKEVIRTVHIVDFDIELNMQMANKKINFYVNNKDYSYTLLPNNIKEYSKDISYIYDQIGIYVFDIYLKSGSHKKYELNLATIDTEPPVGTCNLSQSNGSTIIKMNVTDTTGIAKYSYNGLDFYTDTTTISSIITNATVTAYDKAGNRTDIKCYSEYGLGFRNIPVASNGGILNKEGFIKCGTSVSAENRELKELVNSYGYKTRWAVAAAAEYLARYKYDIGYFWGGKYIKEGLNPEWGCRKTHSTDHKCTKPMARDYSSCEWGLDCTGLVLWAYAQAGFTKEEMRTDDLSGGRWGGTSGKFIAKEHRYQFSDANMYYANQIKPGDIVAVPRKHVGLVIGVSDDKIQIVEMLGPIFVSTLDKRTGRSLNGQGSFGYFVLMDDYFKIYGNTR